MGLRGSLEALIAIARRRKMAIQLSMMISGGAIIAASFLPDFLRGKDLSDVGRVQWAAIAFGGALLLLGTFIASGKWYAVFKRYFIYYPSVLLFVLGIFLLAVNTYGLFVSTRSQLVYEETYFDGISRKAKYTPGEIYQRMDQRTGESNQDYVHRLTRLIFDGMVHRWDTELIDELNLRVPIHENFFMYFRSLSGINRYYTYEFFVSERAIERGVGLCSQMSKVLVDLLIRNGIEAYMYGLEGHVVTVAKVDPNTNIWWMLDADYGVVIPEDIKIIENQPELVVEAYRRAGYSEERVATIAGYYHSAEDNFRIGNNLPYREEILDYYWKWRMPALGMLPFLIIFGAQKINVSSWVGKRE